MIAQMNRIENAARVAMGGVPEIAALSEPRGLFGTRALFVTAAVVICVLIGYGIS